MSTSTTPRTDALKFRLEDDKEDDEREIWADYGRAMESELAEACDRIRDLLKGDDGQAYSEAERFLERLAK